MTDLRQRAKGRECTIRLPGICNFNPDTTVLCHARLMGVTGIGMKAPDLLGAYGCSDCHAEVDRKTRVLEWDFVKLAFYEGMVRTQAQLIAEGVVVW